MRTLLIAAAAVAVLAAAPLAAAQEDSAADPKAEQTIIVERQSAAVRAPVAAVEEMETTAGVLDVDRVGHTVTIKDQQGRRTKLAVPSGVADLDSMESGARLRVRWAPAAVLAVAKSSGAAIVSTTEDVRLPLKGGRRGEIAARVRTDAGTVQNIDRSRKELTLKRQDGEELIMSVPDGLPGAEQLNNGDPVSIRHTEPTAVDAERVDAEAIHRR